MGMVTICSFSFLERKNIFVKIITFSLSFTIFNKLFKKLIQAVAVNDVVTTSNNSMIDIHNIYNFINNSNQTLNQLRTSDKKFRPKTKVPLSYYSELKSFPSSEAKSN